LHEVLVAFRHIVTGTGSGRKQCGLGRAGRVHGTGVG